MNFRQNLPLQVPYRTGGRHCFKRLQIVFREITINIKTQELMEGDLPSRALAMAKEWTKNHEMELLDIWRTQEIKELPPLE